MKHFTYTVVTKDADNQRVMATGETEAVETFNDGVNAVMVATQEQVVAKGGKCPFVIETFLMHLH